MKRILVMLGIGKHSETLSVPETMIDAELVRLTQRVPQTAAEKTFHSWLLMWREELQKSKKGM